MEDKNSELLFEYLRSILYDKKIQPLDVEQLDEPFRKLGRGLQYFAKTFTETKQFLHGIPKIYVNYRFVHIRDFYMLGFWYIAFLFCAKI